MGYPYSQRERSSENWNSAVLLKDVILIPSVTLYKRLRDSFLQSDINMVTLKTASKTFHDRRVSDENSGKYKKLRKKSNVTSFALNERSGLVSQ